MRRDQQKVTEQKSFPMGSHLIIATMHTGGFDLWCGDELVGHCASAKRLSDWAFEHGAQSVRHDYDGRLSDGEP